jgi:hypothetical protein
MFINLTKEASEEAKKGDWHGKYKDILNKQTRPSCYRKLKSAMAE